MKSKKLCSKVTAWVVSFSLLFGIAPINPLFAGIVAKAATVTVTTFTDLQNAITDFNANATEDTTITIGANFNITARLDISGAKHSHKLTITSDSTTRTLTRTGGASNMSYLFSADNGADLTFENIIIDGGNNTTVKSSALVRSWQNSRLTITNGATLRNNNASSNGGGVYVSNGTFNMNGTALISNNTATFGGGVYIIDGGIFNMSGGTINTNTVTNAGGGVHIIDGGIFNMSGGAITNNEASSFSGGVYLDGSAASVFEMSGGTISGNKTTGTYNGGGIYHGGGKLILGGTAVIKNNTKGTDNNNVYLPTSGYITLGTGANAPTSNMEIWVTTSNGNTGDVIVNSGAVSGDENYFRSDKSGYFIKHNGNDKIILEQSTVIMNFTQLQNAINAFNTSATGDTTLLIGGDFNLTATLTISNTSHTLTLASDVTTQTLTVNSGVTNAFSVANGAVFALQNIIIDGTAGASAIANVSGTFSMNSGRLNASANYAVYNNNAGTVNIGGGAQVSATTGSAVYNDGNGTVNIGGNAQISATTGRAVNNNSGGTVNISGNAQVSATTGRTVNNNGGGTVNIGGGAQISATSGTAVWNDKDGVIKISETALVTSTTAISTVFLSDGGTTANQRLVISGGTVTNSASGIAVRNISIGTVNISGGMVSATTGDAVYNSSSGSTVISGGTVRSTTGYAVNNYGTGAIHLTGGLAFAYGTDESGVINGSYNAPSGNGVVIAWDNTAGNSYAENSTNGIVIEPAGATAKWGKNGSDNGISYSNNGNNGFIPLPVTITAPLITYTVTYNLNGGTGTAPTETEKAQGAIFTAAAMPTGITPPGGMDFKEWNTKADGNGQGYGESATVTMPGNNLTLYAIWETAPTYGILLNPAENKIFASAVAGYGAQTAHSVTINNEGNQATGALTIALSGTDASSFSLNKTSITDIAAGASDSFTVVPNTGLSVKTYTATVTVSGANIAARSFDVSFTVTQDTPSALTPPTASAITYGAALSTSTLSGGSPGGVWVWTDDTIIPTIGNSYEVTFTPTDTVNYDWTNIQTKFNVNVTVNPKELTGLSFSATSKDYDGNATVAVTPSALNAGNGVRSGDVVSLNITAAFDDPNVGTGKTVTITAWSLTGASAANYSLPSTKPTVTADINPATLTITAEDKTIGINDPEPIYTYTVTGLKGSDTKATVITADPTMSVSGFDSTTTGIFDIIISGGATNSNYTPAYVKGLLTVTVCTHATTTTVTTVPATCVNDGQSSIVCTDICKAVLSTSTIPATGKHVYSSYTEITPAACETDGAESATCSNCGTTDTRAIPAAGHSPKAVDCTQCDNCATVLARTCSTSNPCAFHVTPTPTPNPTPNPNPNPRPRPTPTPTPPEPKPEPEPLIKKADINGDGKVTPSDALIVLKVTVRIEKPTAAEIELYDMNGDGRITPRDALIILKLAIAQGSVPVTQGGVPAAVPPEVSGERVKKEKRG